MEYIATYSHGENGQGGRLSLNARTDDEACAEVREFVAQGYRDETAASVELADGNLYQAWNAHGVVKARHLRV